MSKTAKIIISISAIVLAIITAVLIWMYYPAIKTAINGERYYTLEDVENAYNDGVNDKEEMESQINFYKIEIDKYIKDIADYQSKIKELNANLQDAINSGNADKETIAGLLEDLAEAQADITAKQEQIEALQDDIEYYQSVLEAYENQDKCAVTIISDDEIYDTQIVNKNEYIDFSGIVEPSKYNHVFKGYSLTENGEVQDFESYPITTDLIIYAIFELQFEFEGTYELNLTAGHENEYIEKVSFEITSENGEFLLMPNFDSLIVEEYGQYDDLKDIWAQSSFGFDPKFKSITYSVGVSQKVYDNEGIIHEYPIFYLDLSLKFNEDEGWWNMTVHNYILDGMPQMNNHYLADYSLEKIA